MASITSIGETAGKLWAVLDKNGKISVSSLEKKVKASPREIAMAIGWLAREGKIEMTEEKRILSVKLSGR